MMTFVIFGAAFCRRTYPLFRFGLGTILMQVVAIFFAVTVAVAMTAFVHLLNNLFKLALLWGSINWPVVWRLASDDEDPAVGNVCLIQHNSSRV